MDAKNTFRQHFIVGLLSLILVCVFYFFVETSLTVAFARTSFVLLFFTLLIGPVMKLKKTIHVSSPFMVPWSWRGELGIWFTITGLAHFIILLTERSLGSMIKIGGSGYALANFIGLVALLWALLLTITSFKKVIMFLGVDSWKWLHTMTYVIFYLISAHYIYFQFFSSYGEVGPDWFGYVASVMTAIIIILQLVGFATAVKREKAAE